jgi:D-3-phosphoglycerate dehydrogenase
MGVEKVELDDLLARADVITLHTPLTDKTRNILGRESRQDQEGRAASSTAPAAAWSTRPPGGCARQRHVGGAGFDVFVTEPAKENVLFGRTNVVCHAAPGRQRPPKRRRTSRCRSPSRCRTTC